MYLSYRGSAACHQVVTLKEAIRYYRTYNLQPRRSDFSNSPSFIHCFFIFIAFVFYAVFSGQYANVEALPQDLEPIDLKNKLSNCRPKSMGVSAGKVCDFDGRRYVFKSVDQPMGLSVEPNMVSQQMNFKFLRDLDIQASAGHFFRESNSTVFHDKKVLDANMLYGTPFEHDFIPAQSLVQKIHRNMMKHRMLGRLQATQEEDYLRHEFVSNIGNETGLAQLTIASLFIHDVAVNLDKWGVVGDNIMIIDADLSPTCPKEYQSASTTGLSQIYTVCSLYLTTDTLLEMKKILLRAMGSSVGLQMFLRNTKGAAQDYQQIIHIFFEAIADVLRKISTTKIVNKKDVNEILMKSIQSNIGWKRLT